MSKARFLANVVTSTGAISSDVLSTVIDGAPSALNTLNEIAAAINDDPNYATTLTTALSGKVPTSTTLTINGVGHSLAASRTWTIDSLPSQSTHSGKYLTTDGTTATWATVDALPSQSTHSGKYLTTNGTVASWAAVSVTPTAVSDQTNSSTGYFDLPVGTTEQRPASPGNGMIRFNTTTGYLEYYNATSWSSITSPPAITSISPINYSGNAGTTITINGVFFDSTTTVEFSPSGGSYTQSSSVTFISSNQITATTPLDYTVAQGPLSIKVTTGAGLTAISANSLTTGSAPTWSTASGTLVTVSAASAVSTSVLATDSETGGAIQDYAITSGALPSGVTLNTSTGAITGTSPSPLTDTTYTFGITATDNAGNTTTERSFNIVVIGTQYSVEYLIVAGGGGGGRAGGGGGGGGAGGMLTGSTTVNASNGYSFTIGAGASGSTSQYSGTLNNGSNSTAFGLTAIGGGGGSSANQGSSFGSPGGNGGSGGGGAQRNGASGGSGTSGQGNNGGTSTGSSSGDAGGGGGGKGSAGVNGSGTTTGGAGGSGATWVNGETYAGGGGGGYSGAGGSGGGGTAGANGGGGGNATSNTGGGGGGNNNSGNGGNGGSGIIIVRYSGSQKGTGGTVTSVGGYTYHTFTSSGTYTA
jgi:hypothetical protein